MIINYKIRVFIFLTCLICFFVVLYLMSSGKMNSFDNSIRNFFYALRHPWLTNIFIAITNLGNQQTIILLNVAMLIFPGTRKRFGIPCSVAALASAAINRIVKNIVLRARPDKNLHLIQQGGLSFPSGHAMTGLVFYGMLAYGLTVEARKNGAHAPLFRAAAAAVCVLIFLIGISRIYLGVHYPSDVLAGWLLGGALLTAAVTIRDCYHRPIPNCSLTLFMVISAIALAFSAPSSSAFVSMSDFLIS